MSRTTKDVDDIEALGVKFSSQDQVTSEVGFTPSGRVIEATGLVNWYSTKRDGDLINIDEFPASVNPGTNVLTIPAGNLLATGDEVMLHAVVTQPGGTSRTTRYYWRSASGTTGTLYASKAQAINTGETAGLVDITTAGLGVVLSAARPLVLHFLNGLIIRYFCPGLMDLSSLRFQAGETLLGELLFRIFARPGSDPDDMEGSYYELDYAPYTGPSFDPADLPRQYPTLTWAQGAPFTEGLLTRAGAQVDFALETAAPVDSDAFGEDALGRTFRRIDVEVKASPHGVLIGEAMAALRIESGKRSDDLSGDGPLDIDTPRFNFRLPDAALIDAPHSGSSTDQATGEFTWRNAPTFTEGERDPIFELTDKEA